MALKVTTEPRKDRQLAVSIEAPQERVEQELRKAANKVASQYRLPGFRKGKAPYHVVVQQFGLANLYTEFVDDLGQELFRTAMEQEGIEPYATASLEDIQFEPLTFKLLVPLEPIITLGDYRGVRVEADAQQLDEEAVEARLDQLREQYASWQSVERPSQYGDMLTIDVKSVIAPEAEGGEPTIVLDETDWDVTPDEENPMDPPGFDAALIGVAPGKTKEFDLSWPEGSQSIHAGKQAHFTVTVKEIQAYEKPELNDDLAKLAGPDFETLEDVRKSIRETLESGNKEQAENAFVEKALDAVIEISTLEYPPAVIEDQMDAMMQEFERRLRMFGIENIDRYFEQVGEDKERYRESLRAEAEKTARRNLIISELLRTEQIEVGDEEIEERIAEMIRVPADDEPAHDHDHDHDHDHEHDHEDAEAEVEAEAEGDAELESDVEAEDETDDEADSDEEEGEEETELRATAKAQLEEQSQALANLLRSSSGREVLRNQLLQTKTVERLLAIVRGEEVPPLPEPAPAEAPAAEVPAPEAGSETSAETSTEPSTEA